MHFIIEFSNGIAQLSSVYNICAIKSMIVLEMKCPQLSKPEATAARNENSIGDRMEKKPWEKPGSVGGPVPLRPCRSVSRENLMSTYVTQMRYSEICCVTQGFLNGVNLVEFLVQRLEDMFHHSSWLEIHLWSHG